MNELGNLSDYLNKSLGLKCDLDTSDNDLAKTLPIHLRRRFDVSGMKIEERPCVIAVPRVGMTGSELKAAVAEMTARLGKLVVLCLGRLDAVVRRVLVSSKTAFVVPDKQVYLPTLCTILNERGLQSEFRTNEETLSPSAQLLVLYHLQVASLDGMSLKEAASALGYSAKTITVILPELVNSGLCTPTNEGREKRLRFVASGKELWQRAKPYMASPVKRVAYTDVLPESTSIRYSFDSAMAHYSFLAAPRQSTIALSAKSDLLTDLPMHPTEGTYRVELWKYDPSKLSASEYVDPLSLILSYKDSDDERIDKEIELLENKIL
jgi:DNA-binding MarR family transcriptional regulator